MVLLSALSRTYIQAFSSFSRGYECYKNICVHMQHIKNTTYESLPPPPPTASSMTPSPNEALIDQADAVFSALCVVCPSFRAPCSRVSASWHRDAGRRVQAHPAPPGSHTTALLLPSPNPRLPPSLPSTHVLCSMLKIALNLRTPANN